MMNFKGLTSMVMAFTMVLVCSVSLAAENAGHAFFDSLSALCGSRYVGEMTYPVDGQDSFKGKLLVAELSSCDPELIKIPFFVGEDKSRTWFFTKTKQGIRLKHDHRHSDGSPDDLTNYGGDATELGGLLSQSFPADAFTQELIPEASTNVWSVSFSEDKQTLTYHLERHGKPRFTAVLQRVLN